MRVNTVIMILFQKTKWRLLQKFSLFFLVYECNENDKNVQKMSKNIKNLLFFSKNREERRKKGVSMIIISI